MNARRIDWRAIEALARDTLVHAYAPYSKYRVSCALLTADGRLFSGVNVENASYGLTLCAERNAIAAAVAAGSREITALGIVVAANEPATPCGACRQVMREFPPGFPIRSWCASEQTWRSKSDVLLPASFGPDNLRIKRR